MIATLDAPVSAPSWPKLTYSAQPMDRGVHTVIHATAQLVHVYIDNRELTPRGAYFLTIATAANLARGHWSGSVDNIPNVDTAEPPSLPLIIFEVDQMNEEAPVAIVDGHGHLRVIVDHRELSEEGAFYLTLAVREHLATGFWRRTDGGLWI